LVEIPSVVGSLRDGSVGSPRFVHPLLAVSDADRDLVALTYAGLMGTTGDGSLTPVLAERYEIGDDGRTYTFTIREEAVFHDGVRVTAEDVLFTIEKAQDPLLKSPKRPNWEGVAVEALDERTVVFH
jgi:peptide/nickel transport system substrate-binding protein